MEPRRLLASAGGIIAGTVFLDSNQNTTQDASEQSLSGFRVYLDLNHNGKFDRHHEPSVRSGFVGTNGSISLDGTYRFVDVRPGTYRVRATPALGDTPPVDGIDVTVVAGKTSEVNIPNAPAARFTGHVFEDTNRNGRPDANEIGAFRFTIYFDLNHNGIEEWGEPFGHSGQTEGDVALHAIP